MKDSIQNKDLKALISWTTTSEDVFLEALNSSQVSEEEMAEILRKSIFEALDVEMSKRH